MFSGKSAAKKAGSVCLRGADEKKKRERENRDARNMTMALERMADDS